MLKLPVSFLFKYNCNTKRSFPFRFTLQKGYRKLIKTDDLTVSFLYFKSINYECSLRVRYMLAIPVFSHFLRTFYFHSKRKRLQTLEFTAFSNIFRYSKLEFASVSSFLYGNSCSFIFMLFPHDVSYLLAIASFLPVLILILCWPSCAQTPLSRCLFRMSHLQ